MDLLRRAADILTYHESKEDTQIVRVPPPPPPMPPSSLSTADLTGKAEEADVSTLKPTTLDTFSRAPMIDETVIREKQEIIQPVIHREVEKTEVRHVIQPVYQEQTIPAQIEERVLEPEFRGEISGDALDVLGALQASSEESKPTLICTTSAATTTTVVNEPIVHETIKPHIIEEVQPIIHRIIHEPVIVHERKDIYEKIVEAPVDIVETREPIYEKEVFLSDPAFSHAKKESREAM